MLDENFLQVMHLLNLIICIVLNSVICIVLAESLTDLLLALVMNEKSCCETAHLPVIFGSYNATLSQQGKRLYLKYLEKSYKKLALACEIYV